MANSDRKIIRGVQIGTTTYTSGQEDELDKSLSSEEVKRLSDKGYIEGKWSGAAPKVEEAKPEDPKTDRSVKREK